MIVPPFWSIPVRAPDLAAHDDVAAAQRGRGQGPGVAVDLDHARHHVLARRPADATGDVDLGAVDQPAREVPEAALERDLAALQDPDAQRVLGARVADGHLVHALAVDQPAQLEVDLPRGQVARVEARALAVDLSDVRDRLVELDQTPRVKPRLRDRAGRGYRVHTITSLSYGS